MKTSSFEQQGSAEIRQAAQALTAYQSAPWISDSLKALMKTSAAMLQQAATDRDALGQGEQRETIQ